MIRISPVLLSLVLISMSSCTYLSSRTGDENTGKAPDESILMLTLKLDQSVYTETEAIHAILSLSNSGQEELVVNSRMAANNSVAPELVRDLEFVIVSPSGQKAEFKVKVNVSPLGNDDFTTLAAASSVQANYDLVTFYSLNETGNYSIYAVYENQLNPTDGRNAWKGRIESNKIEFEIR